MTEPLEVVVLERPVDTWDSPVTAEFFHKTMSMRLRGYGRKYEYGLLPVNTADFIADHIVIGERSTGVFRPVTGWRSISEGTCHQFGLEFSAFRIKEHDA